MTSISDNSNPPSTNRPGARSRAWYNGKQVLSRSFKDKGQFVVGAGVSGALIGALGFVFGKISNKNDSMQSYLPEAQRLVHVHMYDPTVVRGANDLLELVRDFVPSQLDKLIDCLRIIEAIAVCWYAASLDGVLHSCTSDLAFCLSKEAQALINDLILCVPFQSRVSDKMSLLLQDMYDVQGELQDSVFALVKYEQL
jgi:hypothetical protein